MISVVTSLKARSRICSSKSDVGCVYDALREARSQCVYMDQGPAVSVLEVRAVIVIPS